MGGGGVCAYTEEALIPDEQENGKKGKINRGVSSSFTRYQLLGLDANKSPPFHA